MTRAIAIVPAAIVTIWYGESGTAKLLILSQVILSLQLPFAIVPLVMFTADRSKMGPLVASLWVTALAVVAAALIIGLNVKLLFDQALGEAPLWIAIGASVAALLGLGATIWSIRRAVQGEAAG